MLAPMTTAVTYLRVSSADQVRNTSLDDQDERTKKHLADKGWSHLRTFREEGRSAKDDNRPQLKELLRFCAETEVDYVVCLDMSRLSRDVETFLRIRKSLAAIGTKLSFISYDPGDSPEGIFIATVSAAASELENRLRGMKAKNGMLATRKAGGWTTFAPKGYKLCRRGRLPSLEPNEESIAVRNAFESVAAGQKTIYEAAKEIGIARPEAFFRRAVFAGYNEIDGELVKGSWIGIVPLSTWHRVQDRMKNRTNRKHSDFWLRGHLCCECGHLLTASYSQGRTRKYGYYHCHKCKARHPARKLEARYKEWIAAQSIIHADVLAGIKKKSVSGINELLELAERERAYLSAEETKISHRLSALVDMRLDGEIGEEDYEAKRTELVNKRSAIRQENANGALTSDECVTLLDNAEYILSRFTEFLGAAGFEELIILARALVGSTVTVSVSGELSNRENDGLYWLKSMLPHQKATVATPSDWKSNLREARIIGSRWKIARAILEEVLGRKEA